MLPLASFTYNRKASVEGAVAPVLIRTVFLNEEPHLVLSDVCEALDIKNPADASCRIDDGSVKLVPIQTAGGIQTTAVIDEPGLYQLIFTSRRPEALAFSRWVRAEVLPSLRKRGWYITADGLQSLMQDPEKATEVVSAAVGALREAQTRLFQTSQALAQKDTAIANFRAKAMYYDTVMRSHYGVKSTDIAHNCGISVHKLHQFLRGARIMYRQGESWYLYTQYRGRDLTVDSLYVPEDQTQAAEPRVFRVRRWTFAGEQWLYQMVNWARKTGKFDEFVERGKGHVPENVPIQESAPAPTPLPAGNATEVTVSG